MKIANNNRLIRGFDKIDLRKNGLEVFNMRCPISGFFQLILGVFPKLIPNTVNESLGIPEVFFEEDFQAGLYNKSAIFVGLLISKANSIA